MTYASTALRADVLAAAPFADGKIAIVSDGRAGHLNQSLGLAAALGVDDPEIIPLRPTLPGRLSKHLPVSWGYKTTPKENDANIGFRKVNYKFISQTFIIAKSKIVHPARKLKALVGPHHHILIACFPKSGSSWLRTIFSEVPGFKHRWISYSNGRGEQELGAAKVARAAFGHFVAQQHVRYHHGTQRLIDQFDLKPVVLIRDIGDCVVSLRDHIRKQTPEIPHALVNEDVLKLDDAGLSDFLIDMAVPWYMDFFVSWNDCPNAIRVRYEELRSDPHGTVADLAKQLNLNLSDETIRVALEAAGNKNTRLNKGTSGRGAELSQAQWDRIARQAQYYPSVDFRPIGLPR